MEVITTDQCETCINGSIIEESKARIYVHCALKGKTYFFGQCINCDDYKKRSDWIIIHQNKSIINIFVTVFITVL